MRSTKGSQYLSSPLSSHLATTLANSGDILFSSPVTNHRSSPYLLSSSQPPSFQQHQNSSVFSLVDPNIELPTISANEVEQVLSQLQSTSSSQSSAPPPSRKTSGYWFSKDDSFTPPPIKRSFGGSVMPVVTCTTHQTQSSQSLQTRSSSLFAALQLPPMGVGQATISSSVSPPLHAALRRQLLTPSTAFINLSNAAKQRQENLTVRLANRAKLTAAARIPVVVNPSTVSSECTTPTRSVASQAPTSTDLHISQDPNERFRFVCPHPRCGRRYQARIGLTRHLVKYHGENVESEEVVTLKPNSDPLPSSTAGAVCNEEATLSRSSVSSCTTTAGPSSSLKLCFSVRTVRVDQRSSQSLDRSKVQRRCPSPPPPSSSSSTLACPLPSSALKIAPTAVTHTNLRSQTSPSLASDRQTTTTVSGAPKVAIVSVQRSPPPISVPVAASTAVAARPDPLLVQQPPPPPTLQPQSPFLMGIYSNDVTEPISTCKLSEVLSTFETKVFSSFIAGGAQTDPWCCSSSDRTAPLASVPHCSSSCCWQDDCEFEHEEDEEDFLEEDCSSDLGFDSYYYPSRPTDSLPCLLHPTYPRHFHSPPPSLHLLPRGSAVDLSTAGMTEECSSCCWTADSDFSSSLGGGRGGRHSSEDGRGPNTGGFWTSPYPRVPPTRQRKQRLSSTSSAMLFSRRRFSTTVEKKMRWRRGERHGRRRTVSSSGGSSGGLPITAAPNAADVVVGTARSASVTRNGKGDKSSSLAKGSDELVACPIHDCGLVCSGCENLCEHLKECHLPDCKYTSFRHLKCSRINDGCREIKFYACGSAVPSVNVLSSKLIGFKSSSSIVVPYAFVFALAVVIGFSVLATVFITCRHCLLTARNKPVRLIFACPVKSCRTFCANEAAFEAHFDAHLESHISGKIGDFFRRTSTDYEAETAKSKQHQRRRHVKSASSLVDLNMDVFGSLCLPVSPADQPICNRSSDDPSCSVNNAAKLDSPSTSVALLDGMNSSSAIVVYGGLFIDSLPVDALLHGTKYNFYFYMFVTMCPFLSNLGENWSLLQALDLLPDDVLHELLQEKTSGSNTNGAWTGPSSFNAGESGNTPTLSNGSSGGIGSVQGSNMQHLQQQTPMVVSCSSSSDSETSVSVHSERCHQCLGGGSVVKRQRNSLTCLDFPRSGQVGLSRTRSTQLQSKKEPPPPNSLPSASQLLFPNKSVASHAVSTEDVFHLPEAWHQVCPEPDSTRPNWREEERSGVPFGFLEESEKTPTCHLSDTDMPPLSSCLLPTPTTPVTATAYSHHRRYTNRLKRRRRALGERFYTLDSRYLSPQQDTSSNSFEVSQHN
ncbi:unnamed protein product [Hydatigera taeniaeformis]|uniref:C2H2-type domain-containing protein n=1 Tax=Hydatigena taeniaeformis TaxID=6205 RepID=A0A0R3WLG5_HYDTA|nr:unnamed protein product [Hydatigera taeniaeformis]